MFLPWYSWKIAELALKTITHSLTKIDKVTKTSPFGENIGISMKSEQKSRLLCLVWWVHVSNIFYPQHIVVIYKSLFMFWLVFYLSIQLIWLSRSSWAPLISKKYCCRHCYSGLCNSYQLPLALGNIFYSPTKVCYLPD